MDVFALRSRLVKDSASYIESFITNRDDRIKQYVIDMQPKYSSRASQDPEAARKLWQVSEDLAHPG